MRIGLSLRLAVIAALWLAMPAAAAVSEHQASAQPAHGLAALRGDARPAPDSQMSDNTHTPQDRLARPDPAENMHLAPGAVAAVSAVLPVLPAARFLAGNTTAGGEDDDDAPLAKASTPEVRMAGQLGGAVFLLCTVVLIVYWVRQNKQEKSKAIAEGR